MATVDDLRSPRLERYYGFDLPHDADDIVAAVVRAYREANPAGRREMLDAVDERAAWRLLNYGARMAMLAVRWDSAKPLRGGIVAMCMAYRRIPDPRDFFRDVGAVNHSATTVGTTITRLVTELRECLPDEPAGEFLRFDERAERNKSLPAMALAACGPREKFRYVNGPTTGNGWIGRKYW